MNVCCANVSIQSMSLSSEEADVIVMFKCVVLL